MRKGHRVARTPENHSLMLGKRSTRRMNAAGSLLWFSHAHRFFTCTCAEWCREDLCDLPVTGSM